MRIAILAAIAIVLVGGFFMVQRYLDAEGAARTVREQTSAFPGLLRKATGDGPATVYAVKEIVAGMADAGKGVKIARDDVEVVGILIEVGEGKRDCDMPEWPPEFDKLNTLDQGNLQNLAIRCRRELYLVGFRATATGPNGKRFRMEGWSYARGFTG